uniref:GATOR2 complex protein WDR24 n=1 Tax=Strigamia maritima TaxID=126957 RepID=T1J8H5_STRMM
MGVKTIHVVQEAHANAMATNKDANLVAIAGRNIFKVFTVEDDEIVERMNLRIGKNINLNYSTGDVVWSYHDDMLLATAATNGSVVTWRLDKSSLSKQDMVFHDHRRTVHKVNFHPVESNLLLSGSQDGTMKLFDLRKRAVVSTFYSNSESVRDVEFSPFQHTTFAAVQENGNVQIWDLRRPDRCDKNFTAHSGPVFACNWHPEEKYWLATAGRDKTIKVWDLESKKFVPEFTIHTIASVTHVKWRPQRKFHIASTSLVVDFTINIWDLRRPFIPLALFNEHKDVTTAITWRNDPAILLSTSKDNTLYQHTFVDAIRPAERANPAGLDINCKGDVVMAMSKKLIGELPQVVKETHSVAKIPAFFRKVPMSVSEQQFRPMISTLKIGNNINEKYLSTNWFLESAKKYQLTGHSVSEICGHNAGIASALNRHQEATCWNVLKYLYPSNSSINEVKPSTSSELEKDSIHYFDTPNNDQRTNRHQIVSTHRHYSVGGKIEDRQPGETSTGFSEEETETDDTDYEWTLTNIASGVAYNQDFYIDGDDEGLQLGFSGFTMDNNRVVNLESKMAMINWQLPMEAFEPRIDLTDPSPIPEHVLEFSRQGDLDQDELVTVMSSKLNESGSHSEDDDVHSISVDNSYQNVPEWDFNPLVVDMLSFYASQGDMQMAVSILIVLGERIKSYIDTAIQEEWYQVYLDLLARFKLYTTANQIIKLSPLKSISSMNQQSTSIHTNCICGHPLGRLEWFCDRCKSGSNVCAVCHQLVKGLYVWCQGCSHGGHLHHWRTWLEKNRWCPAGCGHCCEYV